jgi:putative ABC transport system substrate-binding protein
MLSFRLEGLAIVKRRDFIALLGGVAASLPVALRAQQGDRVRRIGVLIVLAKDDPQSRARVVALQQGLDQLGWQLGRNLQIEYRFGASDDERARTAASDLLRLGLDVVVANSPPAVRAVQLASPAIPIVFVAVSEPTAFGFVASLAHPGGNITGFTNLESSMSGKWLELLKEFDPQLTRAGFMFNPAATPTAPLFVSSAEEAARKLAVNVVTVPVHTSAEIEAAIARLGAEPNSGLIAPPDIFTTFHHKLIAELATRNRLPSIFPFRYFAAAGGLASYGPDVVDQFRRAAGYVDRILRGEKPGDLPVQQPTKFEFVINLNTAKALGLIVPLALQAAADEVIE